MLLSMPKGISGQDEKLTLASALGYAFEHNPDLKKIEKQIEAEEYAWQLETGLLSPELSFFREGMDPEGNFPFAEQRISLTQTLESPLTIGSRVKAAKKGVDVLVQQKSSYEKKLRAEVKSNYIEVLYARQSLSLRKSQLQLARDLYDAVFSRSESGMATGLELLNAELQLAEAENDHDNTTRELHLARYNLFKTIGLSPEEQYYNITFSDTLYIRSEKIDQYEALSTIKEQPRYIAGQLSLEKNRLLEKSLRLDFLPSFYVSYYLQDYGEGLNFRGFESGISIPLWFGIEQKSRIRMARIRTDELSWQQQATLLEMKKEIEHAWHSYEEYGKMVQRFQETIAESSEKLQRLTLEAYRIGEIDLLNLLNAQQIYLRSRQRYLNALRQYYLQAVELEKFFQDEFVY